MNDDDNENDPNPREDFDSDEENEKEEAEEYQRKKPNSFVISKKPQKLVKYFQKLIKLSKFFIFLIFFEELTTREKN